MNNPVDNSPITDDSPKKPVMHHDTKTWTPPGLLRPLTRKQEAWVKHIVDNPKASYTAAAKATYGKPGKEISQGTAQQIAHDNLSKPNVVLELSKYSSTAESNLMMLANKSTEYAMTGTKEGASYAGVAERTNNSILDRVYGKATQRTEVRSEAVVLNIDLTSTTDKPS